MNTLKALLFTAFLILLFPTSSLAAGSHPNHIAVFLGGTDSETAGSGFTIGVDYEYRFHKNFGIGVMGEYADLDHAAWIVGVPFVLHPWQGLRLTVMPGVEFTDGHSNYLTRVGVGYDFHVGDWSLTPTVNVDFVDGHQNLIFGIAFGRGF